jgi:hypothetical protein
MLIGTPSEIPTSADVVHALLERGGVDDRIRQTRATAIEGDDAREGRQTL